MTRVDPLVFFNWGKGVPDEKLINDSFSVRWTGNYEAATNEELRFEIRGNFPWRDRGKPAFTRLWLNGKLVIDSPQEQTYVRVALKAGQRVDLKLECGFRKGEAAVALNHDTPSLDRRAVLPKHLHPELLGLREGIEVISKRSPNHLARFDFDHHQGLLYWSSKGRDIFGRLTGDSSKVPGVVGDGIELSAKGVFAPALFPIDEELQLPDSEYAVSFWFKTKVKSIPLCEAKRYSSYNNRWSDHVVYLEDGRIRFRLREADELLYDES